MNRIINFWVNLRASLWFIPGLMLILSIVTALGLIELDSQIDGEWLYTFPRVFGLGADGSRGMLTAIASSMLTVVALTFALTLNAMTQASGQFTPRIFRNFMRDRPNQFFLGYFVSVFAYCLLVLRTIRGGDELKFVPSLAVFVGLLLALGGVIALIFFIHHIADSLQITTIIDKIVSDTKAAIDTKFPTEIGIPALSDERKEVWQATEKQKWVKIAALTSGYIQSVDTDGLLEFAEGNQIILRMERGIGQFVGRGAGLMSLTSGAESENLSFVPDNQTERELNDLFSIDRYRTIEQDVGFGIRQIVDIALKALSPGVNDTTTAVNCIDQLGVIVAEIGRRELPSRVRAGSRGARVIAVSPNFQDYVESSFDQIRISGKANLAIFERLVESLSFIAECTKKDKRRAGLKRQIDLIEEFGEQTLETNYEKQKLAEKVAAARVVFAD
ncbi:MAG: DUF2254 domain-containing protein [Pyrinomonadaceae bacterium]